MKLVAIACMLVGSPWLSSGVVQEPPAQEPPKEKAAEQAAAPSWRLGQPVPALEKCEWLQGTTGSGPGKVVKKVGGDGSGGGGDMPFDPKDIEKLVSTIGAPNIAALRGSVIVVHTFDSRDAEMIASGLRLLKEVVDATADRNVKFVGLVASDDGESAKHALEYIGLPTPLGAIGLERRYFDPLQHGPRAAFVIGRGGELVWKGDLVADTKGFCAALKTALEHHAAPALDHALAPELDAVLADYWAGRFAKTRDAAKKFAAKFARTEGDAAKLVAGDATYLVGVIDEHERDLTQRCKQAAAAQSIDALVDLETVLQLGFSKPTADAATDALDEISKKTLHAGGTKDARDWRELERDRPLFFPARNDADGKKFARKVEAFLRATPNSTPPTQRAKQLLAQFQQLR
jgi:hypothetical protein